MIVAEKTAISNPVLEAALAYARLGWCVLPLHSMKDGRCTCGKDDCTSQGKHPITQNGTKDASSEESQIEQWWYTYPYANVGVATGPESGIFMLGPDGDEGIQDLQKLQQQHGQLPETTHELSGGGGEHYIFQCPSGRKVKNRANAGGLKIDVRGEGGYFVAAPSLHKSGKLYTMVVPPETTPPAEAPGWLLDWMETAKGTSKAKLAKKSVVLKVRSDDVDGSVLSRAVAYLKKCPPAISGQNGHDQTFAVARAIVYGFDLGAEKGFELLEEHYNPLCDPVWTDDELRHKCQDADEEEFEKPRGYLLNAGAEGEIDPSGTACNGDDLESLELPEPPPHPVLHPDALYGLAGDIVRTIEPHTESDPVAILAQTLAYFGNIIGRGSHCVADGARHHCNLFMCLVGVTSHGRKGTSKARVDQLFSGVAPEWMQQCMTTGLNSGEGVVHAVRDLKEKKVAKRNKTATPLTYETIIEDHGVLDKRRLVTESEFAQPLKVMRRDGNTLSIVIREAWDGGTLHVMTKNNEEMATNPHISIIGHITQLELTRSLQETELFNGFANRFLWLLVKRSKRLPFGGGNPDLSSLCQRLKEAVEFASRTHDLTTMTKDAQECWEQHYTALTAEEVGLYGAVVARGAPQVLRLSMLYALLDQSPVVDLPHLKAALALWRYCDQSAKIIFGRVETLDPLEAKLLAILRAAIHGMTRTELNKALRGHVESEALLKALASLKSKNLIHRKIQATSGRSAERWFAGSEPLACEKSPKTNESEAVVKSTPTPAVAVAAATTSTCRYSPLPAAMELHAF